MLTTKQETFLETAKRSYVSILNIDDYKNKDSELQCKCLKCGHTYTSTAELLIKYDFECIRCLSLDAKAITDHSPFFLSLDAATYNSGISIFNREGQLLAHKTFSIDKKEDYLTRINALVEEISAIVDKYDIKCVILEDIQYQQNPMVFKSLAMLQGVLRYVIVNQLKLGLITAMAGEWRAYNHIFAIGRQEEKKATMNKAKLIYEEDIAEDEADSIFLGLYGISLYNKIEEEAQSSHS